MKNNKLKLPELTEAARAKLTPQEQEELQKQVLADSIVNIVDFFNKTPIVTLVGHGGFNETILRMKEEL